MDGMNRRAFLSAPAGAALLLHAADDKDPAVPVYQKPVFNLRKVLPDPVKIASIDVLQSGKNYFVLLGKTAHKTAAELMGGIVRKEIPVYLSGSGRDATAEEEVNVYVRGVEATGAKAVKFKIGGRMSGNRDAYPGRTDKLLE